ncbi:hypothetical protein HDU78_005029 [Chytriomyces hyalinus]|nr:hypothetical protein HDU78_005029 [Chytriomyces hyalinus]
MFRTASVRHYFRTPAFVRSRTATPSRVLTGRKMALLSGATLSLAVCLSLGTPAVSSFLPAIHADAAPVHSGPMTVEAESNTPIPSSISLSFGGRTRSFDLIALGIRQVTLLKFSVYVIGLYANPAALAAIKTDKWRTNYNADAFLNGKDGGAYMHDLLSTPNAELTLLVKTVRATTGTHLRQGFTRFLTQRLAEDDKSGAFKSEADQRLAEEAVATLESKFPAGVVAKDEEFWFTKTANGQLRVEYQGRELACVQSDWLARNFFEGYIRAEKQIAPKFRKNLASSFEQLSQK